MMTGWASYLWFEVRRVLRRPPYLVYTIGFPVGFYLLYTWLLGGQAGPVGSVPWAAYYMVSMATFGGLGAAINTNGVALASERASGWSRQLRTMPLPPWGYVVAKALTAVVVAGPSLGLVALAAGLFHHVALSADTWAVVLASAWLGTMPFALLGVALGYLLTTEAAMAAGLVIYFFLAIVGGMWFPLAIMPAAVRHIAEVLPSYHYAALGWDALAGRAPRLIHVAVLAAWGVAFLLLAVWRYRRDEAQEYA